MFRHIGDCVCVISPGWRQVGWWMDGWVLQVMTQMLKAVAESHKRSIESTHKVMSCSNPITRLARDLMYGFNHNGSTRWNEVRNLFFCSLLFSARSLSAEEKELRDILAPGRFLLTILWNQLRACPWRHAAHLPVYIPDRLRRVCFIHTSLIVF